MNTAISYAALIGIDWGHQRHAIALRVGDGAIEQRTLEHSAETVHAWLDELHQRFEGRPVALAIESSRGAVIHAVAQRDWITVYPIHPKTSARYREAFTPSGAKDDQPDADLLLALLERHRDRLTPLRRDDDATRRLDGLCRARRTVVDLRTALLNRLRSLLQGYLPQALELCGEELGAPLALDLLTRWPTLAALQKAQPQTLRSFFYKHNVRRPETVEARLQRVAQARALTTDSVIIDVSVLQVQGLVAQLRGLQKHIATLEAEIATVFAAHPEVALFRELPGAGKVLAPRLAAAFGTDRTRYADAESLGRYVGILPVLERSGGRKWVHWRWSAPKFLRQTFVEWAKETVRYCEWAGAFYVHCKQRGKRPQAIYRALAAKWIRILWRCWTDRTPYDDARYYAALKDSKSPLHALLDAA
jgi:transposase